ncbi:MULTISPECIES: hypothetical protein [Bacillus]|uniref:Uncharacterized protein n=1 Tax=Bacillus haynesii TaxID=1925021 RepID=A0AA90JC96_9BACI|nr:MULTISPECIES: hypothetical protein [Bacillus]MCY7789744.1 hypothetical protein [Bacillus haynesii]MCY7848889.1 hypothetical protein [Bacillus haynesii]MCY8004755.1 hypothetical protein [Bacillus haynesii]MCY8537405.1 hypothetical protein [Bacillus haynesii]MCY8673724.1 hypothetical protein [Bacillus haynesii]
MLKEKDCQQTKINTILIQDPARNCAYYLSSTALNKYLTEGWTNLEAGTVTFVLSNEGLLQELTEITPVDESKEISILIQDPENNVAYYINSGELTKYKCNLPESWGDIPQEALTFIVPRNNLIEELPGVRRGLLQNNTPRPTM